MSPTFEQQVADALGVDHGFGDATMCSACGAPDLRDLARRVADAIEAAADAAAGNAGLMARAAAEGYTVSDNQLENFVMAALDALRGGA